MTTKYDRIGQGYNTTRTADPYLLSRLTFHLNPKATGHYLDIGCGTGNYTIPLSKNGGNFVGVDPSNKMLEIARSKGDWITWKQGIAEAIPQDDHSIDGIVASLTLHHWSDLDKGFKELNRILNPQGTVTIFTSTSKQMEGYWLNHYFPKMLAASIQQMPSFEVISAALKNNNFQIQVKEPYAIHSELQDQFLYCGKNNPSKYLDPAIQNGISSFSDLSNQEEVQAGLKQLETDINTGKIDSIIKEYANDMGDYLFLKADKKL